MRRVITRFFVCNVIIYAAVKGLRMALSAVSAMLGLSAFAVSALAAVASPL